MVVWCVKLPRIDQHNVRLAGEIRPRHTGLRTPILSPADEANLNAKVLSSC